MKKRLGIIAGILGIVLAVIGIVLKQKENTAVSVIGGADGPTSIFIAGKLNASHNRNVYCHRQIQSRLFPSYSNHYSHHRQTLYPYFFYFFPKSP